MKKALHYATSKTQGAKPLPRKNSDIILQEKHLSSRGWQEVIIVTDHILNYFDLHDCVIDYFNYVTIKCILM